MRISDWSSDVCSSDLRVEVGAVERARLLAQRGRQLQRLAGAAHVQRHLRIRRLQALEVAQGLAVVDALTVGAHDHVARLEARLFGGRAGVHACHRRAARAVQAQRRGDALRSEEHTSELQSLMRISYAVFCLKKKTNHNT